MLLEYFNRYRAVGKKKITQTLLQKKEDRIHVHLDRHHAVAADAKKGNIRDITQQTRNIKGET